MIMARTKNVLTIGEVSRICCVSTKTAQRWFDSGILSGYYLPYSRMRRVPINELICFMRQNNIPLEFLEGYQAEKLVGKINMPRSN